MKPRTGLLALAVCLFLSAPATVAHAAGSQALTAGPGSASAAVDAMHDALAAGDAARVKTLLDPSVAIYEGGGVERSRAEYESHHLEADTTFARATKRELKARTGAELDRVAWVASEYRVTGTFKDKPVDLDSTETIVLSREPGKTWRITHIHWSAKRRNP